MHKKKIKTHYRIIVFEDDKKWLERIQNVLESQKFEIEPYDHYSEELVGRLTRDDYDLLITDIALDNIKSKEGTILIKFVRACHKTIPILVVTGYSDDDVLDVVDDLVKSRIDYFIAKSNWDPAYFLQAVKNALNKKKKRE